VTIQDIEIIQGSTFEWLILVKDVNGLPLNMTTYTGGTAGVRGKIRKKTSSADVITSFTVSILNNTGVLAAMTAGRCHLTTAQIAALQTDAVGKCYALLILEAATTDTIGKGPYVYDVEIEDTTGFVFMPFSGAVTMVMQVTR
jgi:hypothetical protein